MTLHTFKWQLKSCLLHIWWIDEQKWHLPLPGAVVAFLWFLPALHYRTSDLLIYFPSYECCDSHSTPDPLTAVTRVVQRSRSWNYCFSLAHHRACSCRPAPSAGRISYSTFQLAATVTQTAISIRRCGIADVCIDIWQ